MLFNEKKHEFEIDGKKASFSTGVLAPKSQATVLAQMGDTVVHVTANSDAPFGEANFFPMSVEYLEKLYASGKIAGSRFVKRERFPSDEAVLKARMIDRSFRSRFPDDYRNSLSIIVTIMSYDEENDPLVLGLNAASAALMLSKAPFEGPISGVRIGLKDGKPYEMTQAEDDTNKNETMNNVLSGDGEKFTMIDSGFEEIDEDTILKSMELGLEKMKVWIEAQEAFVAMCEAPVKEEYESYGVPEDLLKMMKGFLGDEIKRNLTAADGGPEKESLDKVFAEYEGSYTKSILKDAYFKLAKKELRRMVLDDGERVDGRPLDKVRELDFQVGLLPRTHGSGLFTREKTQALTVCTLGNTRMQKTIDGMSGESEKSFMHFYSAMPFSYGEAGRVRLIPGRREVGHGMLAEKALKPVIPSLEDFPYTIHLMSEVMSQNGSSSMASTCGSTLALMDAGVPITKPVAGMAMGVVTNDDLTEFKTLTDIQGIEDFYGDMDFKVTGTRDGITAIQMDNKAAGLPLNVFAEAIVQAKDARMVALDGMDKLMEKPRESVSKYAPKVEMVKIPVKKIGEFIGPGGKNIKALQEDFSVEFDVEEDGTVNIFGENQENVDKAKVIVEGYAFIPEKGKVYDGVVDGIADYGAFVEIAPGVSGLLHISELADGFVKDVTEHVNEGDKVQVKVLDVDQMGKIKLSMKAVGGEKKEVKEEEK